MRRGSQTSAKKLINEKIRGTKRADINYKKTREESAAGSKLQPLSQSCNFKKPFSLLSVMTNRTPPFNASFKI